MKGEEMKGLERIVRYDIVLFDSYSDWWVRYKRLEVDDGGGVVWVLGY